MLMPQYPVATSNKIESVMTTITTKDLNGSHFFSYFSVLSGLQQQQQHLKQVKIGVQTIDKITKITGRPIKAHSLSLFSIANFWKVKNPLKMSTKNPKN
jgi:hypothetical protein